MKDLFGKAILDYQTQNSPENLFTETNISEEDEMDVAYLFRTFAEMPKIEQTALKLSGGKVLDVGCGAGSHSLYLQNERNLNVTPIDISESAIKACQLRGLASAKVQNVLDLDITEKFDTILLLMNGIGLAGTLDGLRKFLQHAASLLKPGGQLIFDSSDVAYVYKNHFPDLKNYYGEIAYRYQYKGKKTDWFNWLYIDRYTLSSLAASEAWREEFITEDENGQYSRTGRWYARAVSTANYGDEYCSMQPLR